MRSPSKGKVVGSIPAEALSFYFSLFDLLCFGSVAQWKRVCLLSRRLWVRPPPESLFLYGSFLFPFSACPCSSYFLSPLPYPVGKGGRVVQGGSLRYCSLRRRGFEPHPLHFSFFSFPPLYLCDVFDELSFLVGPLSIVGSAFP